MKHLYVIFGCIVAVILGFIFYYFYLSKPISPFEKYAKNIPGTYRIGYTNLETEVTGQQLLVKGIFPDWLTGTLLRNGPALFSKDDSCVSNSFDGLAMIHAFTLDNGIVSYTNRFLRTSDYKIVQKTGKMSYAGFAQDPCGSKFKRLISFFIPSKQEQSGPDIPNANVNIARFTNRFVALTEIPLPVEFDPKTLETIGVLDYSDTLPHHDIHDTAHPHYDPIRKEHLGYFTQFDRMSKVNLYCIKDGSTSRAIIASYEVEEPSYMHSFAITPHFAILTMLPFVVNPLDLRNSKSFITNFKWKPELGTKLIIIDRINGKIVADCVTEPFFAFHTVNAFEKDKTIIVDIVSYAQPASDINDLMTTVLAPKPMHPRTGHPIAEPDTHEGETGILTRYTIHMADKKVDTEILSKEHIELPRINYDYNGREYRYVYAYAQTKGSSISDKLVKINVKTGDVLEWNQPNCFPGEPVFVHRPGSVAEDDGVVLSVVLDATKGSSFLLALDATTFTEIARAQVAHHIPFGFHGLYTSDIHTTN